MELIEYSNCSRQPLNQSKITLDILTNSATSLDDPDAVSGLNSLECVPPTFQGQLVQLGLVLVRHIAREPWDLNVGEIVESEAVCLRRYAPGNIPDRPGAFFAAFSPSDIQQRTPTVQPQLPPDIPMQSLISRCEDACS